ncbi:hypothetical protein BASA81_005357 [Batrachochytrium salamandrivorans]|nr:hypothetical protein BASA81_005357 [Batrachochytrium salamandrivorans]
MQRRLSKFFNKGATGKNDPTQGPSGEDGALPEGWVEKYTLDDIPYYYNENTKLVSLTNPSPSGISDDKAEWTWVPDAKEMWVAAEIKSREKDGSTVCVTESGTKVVVPKSGKMKGAETAGRDQLVPLWPLRTHDLMHVEDDLIMLERVNDGSICYNLAQRYRKGMLYTWVGASHRVLVSINPYEHLPIYGDAQVQEHHDKSPNKEVAPHIFDIAEEAYNSMLIDGKHQSILISGESGAGKTEATKQCLKFWAKVAGSKNKVEEKLIQANPVLEAFGNAKTIRNNNSSRFGKWMEVFFSLTDRSIEGAMITNFLLEKSRLPFQQQGERNFHIFYQILTDAALVSKYGLLPITANRYTNKGITQPIKGLDDAAEFKDCQKAMVDLEFTEEEREWLLRVPAAILHLGNVNFAANKVGHSDGSKLLDDVSAKMVAKLLNVDFEFLQKILISRTITVRGEVSIIPLDEEAARGGCDSLAKGIYSRLFDWLVARCNLALQSDHVATSKEIGVLDIFGFEIFEVNSFEQLCINYCNEKLQQLFNIETFREEEKLYVDEGIKFVSITFVDSDPVLMMIEQGPTGIFPVLDDECKLEGDDQKFLAKISSNFQAHKSFVMDKHRQMQNKLSFEIIHYAGTVNYTTSEFKIKNKDTFAQDGYDLGASSGDALTRALFPPLDIKVQVKSLSHTFRTQLNVLMEKLRATETRYVRCVKPNEEMKPLQFDPPLVMRQLRYSGVFEAVAIRKQGFPFRYKYSVFANRFRLVNPDFAYKEKDGKKQVEEILFNNVNLKPFVATDDIAFGKTMFLYRAPVYKMLKLLRNLGLEVIVPRAKNVLRGCMARKMKVFIQRLERDLGKAYDTLTDINAMRVEVAKIETTLRTLPRIYNNVGPRNEAAVRERIRGLEQVEVEEHKVDALMANSDPDSEYKVWVAQLVEIESLDHIPQHPPQKQKFAAFKAKLAASTTAQKLKVVQDEYFALLGKDLFPKLFAIYVKDK